MPVRTTVDESDFWSSIDLDNVYHATSSSYLFSDEMWKQFELEAIDMALDDAICQMGNTDSLSEFYPMLDDDNMEISNHDCMWAGHCSSKEHPTLEDHTKTETQPLTVVKPQIQRPQTILPGRSVLLKQQPPQKAPVAASPDSPPMSDDEEVKAKPTPTLQFLTEAITECDIDEDSDFVEYFEDGEGEDIVRDPEDEEDDDEEEEEDQTGVDVVKYAEENDHCYYMEKSAYSRVDDLGIQTPSDSEEEEIDVVSVNEKLTTRIAYALPTNPSNRDRHHLQKTMANAISRQRQVRIKPIVPFRKPSTETTPVKRKQESRGVKRSISSRSANTSPNKRRAAFTSDSEPEHSEKRSMHNNMERQRRIDLRNAFEDLRLVVPEVSCKEKAAKVAILREAAQYCYELANVSSNLTQQKYELKRQQERLRQRVSQLRRSLAAKR